MDNYKIFYNAHIWESNPLVLPYLTQCRKYLHDTLPSIFIVNDIQSICLLKHTFATALEYGINMIS